MVVKFLGGNGDIIRVSTAKMPQNGKNASREIDFILKRQLGAAEQVK